jgi:hypothetical protein
MAMAFLFSQPENQRSSISRYSFGKKVHFATRTVVAPRTVWEILRAQSCPSVAGAFSERKIRPNAIIRSHFVRTWGMSQDMAEGTRVT